MSFCSRKKNNCMLIAQVRLHEDNVSRTQAEKSMILKALICQFMGEYKFNLKKCK